VTDDEATRNRMDGDYSTPILSGPNEDQPIPDWNPPQTS
jgi:hypothetical protein